MTPYEHVALAFSRIPPEEQLRASRELLSKMAARRSVPFIASDPVPLKQIENAIRCAFLAPSGANQQPSKFVVVKDTEIKRRIREAAAAEERESCQPAHVDGSEKKSRGDTDRLLDIVVLGLLLAFGGLRQAEVYSKENYEALSQNDDQDCSVTRRQTNFGLNKPVVVDHTPDGRLNG